MRYIFVLIFVFLNLFVYSQDRQIVVSVIDKQNGDPLPFCHICTEDLLNGQTSYVTTDETGNASIQFENESIVSISFVGYTTLLDTITGYSPNITYELNPGIGLEELVITGQNKAIPVDRSIYNIKVIPRKRIEQTASNNLAELLSKQSNIRISNDPATGFSSMSLQGISGENVKILVDGVPVIGRMDGNIDLRQLNLSDVDHIEIVEGPMSVMYGSNALGGVVNIITKENKYALLRSKIDTYYETVGIYNVNANLFLKKRSHDLGMNFGRNFFGGYSLNDEERKQDWKPKEQYNAGLQYVYSKQNWYIKSKSDYFRERLQDKSNAVAPYYTKGYTSWFYTNRFNTNLSSQYSFNAVKSLDLLASYSYYSRVKNKSLVDLTNLEETQVPGSDGNDTSVFNAIVFRAVFDSRDEDKKLSYQLGVDINYENAIGKRILNEYDEIGDYAAFASMLWKAFPNFELQPALRFAVNTKYDAPLVPSLNLKYHLGSSTFRFSYARGFRAPSLKELYLYFYDSNHQIEGNEDLQAEYSHNFNLVYDYSNKLFGKAFQLTVATYYVQIFNKISLVQVDPENLVHYRYENSGKYESVGGTLSLDYRLTSFSGLKFSISEIGRKDDFYEKDEFLFSTNVTAGAEFDFLKNTANVSLLYNYYGKYPRYGYDTEGEIVILSAGDYHNMDINISKSFLTNKLILRGGVKNLFDNTEIQGGEGSNGGAHSGGYTSLVGWGRTLFVGVVFNFSKYAK